MTKTNKLHTMAVSLLLAAGLAFPAAVAVASQPSKAAPSAEPEAVRTGTTLVEHIRPVAPTMIELPGIMIGSREAKACPREKTDRELQGMSDKQWEDYSAARENCRSVKPARRTVSAGSAFCQVREMATGGRVLACEGSPAAFPDRFPG